MELLSETFSIFISKLFFDLHMKMMAMNLLVSFLLLLLMPWIPSAYSSQSNDSANEVHDLVVAMEEMQKANYFTFVMLINMAPLDTRLESNVTYLMPHDSTLAKVRIPNAGTPDFLLRHSIPTPLFFGSLLQLPTGTILPSSLPSFRMRISNHGRKEFMLNNVRIISPNLCVSGSSIRCHGIDGVLTEETAASYNSSPPVCPTTAPPPSPSPSAPPPSPDSSFDFAPAPPPSPRQTNTAARKSGSSSWWQLPYFKNSGLVTVTAVFTMICSML